jgi:HD-like signal output (HDOD) protein
VSTIPRPVSPNPLHDGDSLTFKSGKRSVPAAGTSGDQGLTALGFLTSLATELSRGAVDLPCFPNVVFKVRDALNDPKTSIDEAVKLIGAEPRLAARLLQTANSVAFNASGRRVTDLRTAITRLGQQLVQSVTTSFAVQHMKDEPALRSIAKPLSELWQDSIAVACISQVIARTTKVKADDAFLTGLLHGIGRLYIMAHTVTKSVSLDNGLLSSDLIAGWHPSIGKAVLENWLTGEEMAGAVNDQNDYGRRLRKDSGGDLTDVLIVSIILARALKSREPRVVIMEGVNSFETMGLTAEDCKRTLTHAEHQLGSLKDALGF